MLLWLLTALTKVSQELAPPRAPGFLVYLHQQPVSQEMLSMWGVKHLSSVLRELRGVRSYKQTNPTLHLGADSCVF